MNANAEKFDIIQWIVSLEDRSILLQIKKLKEQSNLNQRNTAESISAEERESVLRGIDDSANERVTPHSEVRKKYEKWL
jgi:hypothetical protein